MALKSPGVSSLVDRHRKYFDLDRGEFDKLDRSWSSVGEDLLSTGAKKKNYLVTSCMAFAK
jgi:hypothetical protein